MSFVYGLLVPLFLTQLRGKGASPFTKITRARYHFTLRFNILEEMYIYICEKIGLVPAFCFCPAPLAMHKTIWALHFRVVTKLRAIIH